MLQSLNDYHITIGSVAITDTVWNNNTRIGYHFNCTGNETSLYNCSNNKTLNSFYLNSWYHEMRAGVECQNQTQSGMMYCI